VDDPATWALLKHWTRHDQQWESLRESRGAQKFYPCRLLDLAPGKGLSDRIHLVETDKCNIAAPYMTLSHHWAIGERGPFKHPLRKDNLTQFLTTGIMVWQLPQLYWDIIRVARKLGQRYLWIDELCVITDSGSDCSRATGQMGSIYRNSWCNIAATDAESSHDTLFFARRARAAIRPPKVTVEWHAQGPAEFLLCEEVPEKAPSSRLGDVRVWAVQLLAPRTIRFGRDQIRWEGLDFDASETFPLGEPSALSRNDLLRCAGPLRPRHLIRQWIARDCPASFDFGRPDLRDSPQDVFCLTWQQLVEEYTRDFLAVGPNKLAELFRIASVMSAGERKDSRSGDDPYVAGMWNLAGAMEYQLLWTVGSMRPNGQPAKCQQAGLAPSWSWMSVDGEITYRYQRERDKAGFRQLAHVRNISRKWLPTPDHMTIMGPLVKDLPMQTP